MTKIRGEDIADFMQEIDLPPAYVARFNQHFNLPKPKQVMEIVLRIPVRGMDPMGDTYTMGVQKLSDLCGDSVATMLDEDNLIETVKIKKSW